MFLGVGDESLAASIEHAVDEFWLLVIDEFEQLDRQVVGGDEQGLGARRCLVPVGGTPPLTAILSGFDQASGSERAEVLANRTGRDLECLGELVGGCLAVALQRSEYASLSGRRGNVGWGHQAMVQRRASFARNNL